MTSELARIFEEIEMTEDELEMAIIGFHYSSSYGSMLKTQKRADG